MKKAGVENKNNEKYTMNELLTARINTRQNEYLTEKPAVGTVSFPSETVCIETVLGIQITPPLKLMRSTCFYRK